MFTMFGLALFAAIDGPLAGFARGTVAPDGLSDSPARAGPSASGGPESPRTPSLSRAARSISHGANRITWGIGTSPVPTIFSILMSVAPV